MITKDFYYNPNKLLSFNRILNFVIGARGIGKSYAFKKYMINRFNKQGEQFIYVKRYRNDLKKRKNFFNDMTDEFPDCKFEVKGYEFWINDKLAGWAIPLSTWQSEKSTAYPDVGTIFFDEFIKEKDMSHYLPNEVEALMNLCDTVFRTRDNVRCVCAANSVTIVNPYFLYFNLVPDVSKRYNKYDDIMVEIPESYDFAEERKKTKFGALIEGTTYGEMSLGNEFIGDSQVFIEKRPKDSRFQFSIVFQGMTFGIWVDAERRTMYLSVDYDPSTKKKFVLTKDDLDENTLLMFNWRENYYLFKMVRAFKNGVLRFDNQVVRNTAYDMFKKMRIQ